jgi:hypothetical protein
LFVVGDAPLEVIIGDGAGIDDNLGNDNENDDGRDSAKKGPGGLGSLGSSLSGIDGGDDTGLRKGSLGGPAAATSRKGSNLQGDDSRGPGKEA